MSRIDNDEYDDVSQQIKINAIHREAALLAATDLINASQQNLYLNLNLPTSDLMIVCHALITQREYAELKTWPILNDIALKLEVIAESIDCVGAKAPLADDIKLTALTKEQALAALKERWLYLHSQHTEAEYLATMTEFEKLLGL